MSLLVTRMIGTLAVILVVAYTMGGSELFGKYFSSDNKLKYALIAGIIGGIFGIYGNISGVPYEGAIISVRDMGPMLAGLMGGPFGGLLAGFICGAHRLYLGGISAKACIIATCCIGTGCGILAKKNNRFMTNPLGATAIGIVSELFHLCVLLAVVRPFETALAIVKGIGVPFVLVNAIGFTLLIAMMTLIERQRGVMVERGRLQFELETATVIQRSLLPPIGSAYPNREEIDAAAWMETAKEVGGDFYDLFPVGADRFALVIADVSGKGIPAALFMSTAKQTLQICLKDIDDIEEAVSAANNSLCRNNEADMFLTAWVGVLDLKNGSLEYVSAGHNPPVMVTADGARFPEEKSCFVLAGMEDMPYKKHQVTLGSGDKIFLYTDGVTEAEKSDHEQYGDDRLLARIDASKDKSPQEIIKDVRDDIDEFVESAEQFDDITMMCIRMN